MYPLIPSIDTHWNKSYLSALLLIHFWHVVLREHLVSVGRGRELVCVGFQWFLGDLLCFRLASLPTPSEVEESDKENGDEEDYDGDCDSRFSATR